MSIRCAGRVSVVVGDIRDANSLLSAADGAAGIIHTAAILGGTWSTYSNQEFWDANYQGTVNVFEAARRVGNCRVVDLDTLAILDWSQTITERSPIAEIKASDMGYLAAKRASYYEGMHRTCRGPEIIFITPAAIYGPSLFVERAIHPTSFTGTLVLALRGKLESYAKLPLLWAYAEDVAATSLAAFERGQNGARYLATERDEDARSLASFCNLAAELAGVPHRVRDQDVTTAILGPRSSLVGRKYADPIIDTSHTRTFLGVAPRSVVDGLRSTVDWLRQQGKI